MTCVLCGIDAAPATLFCGDPCKEAFYDVLQIGVKKGTKRAPMGEPSQDPAKKRAADAAFGVRVAMDTVAGGVFDMLPDEAKIHVLQYLSAVDLTAVIRTGSAQLVAAAQDPALWRNLYINFIQRPPRLVGGPGLVMDSWQMQFRALLGAHDFLIMHPQTRTVLRYMPVRSVLLPAIVVDHAKKEILLYRSDLILEILRRLCPRFPRRIVYAPPEDEDSLYYFTLPQAPAPRVSAKQPMRYAPIAPMFVFGNAPAIDALVPPPQGAAVQQPLPNPIVVVPPAPMFAFGDQPIVFGTSAATPTRDAFFHKSEFEAQTADFRPTTLLLTGTRVKNRDRRRGISGAMAEIRVNMTNSFGIPLWRWDYVPDIQVTPQTLYMASKLLGEMFVSSRPLDAAGFISRDEQLQQLEESLVFPEPPPHLDNKPLLHTMQLQFLIAGTSQNVPLFRIMPRLPFHMPFINRVVVHIVVPSVSDVQTRFQTLRQNPDITANVAFREAWSQCVANTELTTITHIPNDPSSNQTVKNELHISVGLEPPLYTSASTVMIMEQFDTQNATTYRTPGYDFPLGEPEEKSYTLNAEWIGTQQIGTHVYNTETQQKIISRFLALYETFWRRVVLPTVWPSDPVPAETPLGFVWLAYRYLANRFHHAPVATLHYFPKSESWVALPRSRPELILTDKGGVDMIAQKINV
jgi:hypothetical protein